MKAKEFNDLSSAISNELIVDKYNIRTLIPNLRNFINYMRYYGIISERQYLELMELIYRHIDRNKLWLTLG